MRLIRLVSRRMLVDGMADGAGIMDLRCRDLVLLAGGAANWAATLVLDRVFCDGAVGSTTGVEPVRRRRLRGSRVTTGSWAVVVDAVVVLAGSTLGTGLGTTRLSYPMERVMRILGGTLFVSTLGAGWASCVRVCAGVCRLRRSAVIVVASMSAMSSRNLCVESPLFKPLMALMQSVMACMILS